ncbi:MAG: SDR family oxidoreductase [Pseudomonadales bacterium]|nr:SDR family oxidoreductase [Pseudomonadales bacterium]MBO6566310.1 SDR family oxidoreductase [Pseudomonadales bacterium]MBO6597865.1 SDR family oxidoreductase [Pseudomonadales bacterium]MBO6824273.1 SDR family oxidoreductase [Pseudomonadales bacterium]
MIKAAEWIDLTGKVAHVTGGGKGIGKGIATALAMAGAKVMVSDIDLETAQQTANEIGGAAMALNVADRDQVDAAMAQTVEALGSLDILVNNAGLYLGYGGPVENITDEMWQALWSVNVDGVFYCCRAAATIMKQQGGGRIINIASTQARTPGVGVTYDGSKAAVEMITKSLALELAPHGINVNALAPGPTWVNEGEPPPVDAQVPPKSGDPLADTVADRIARLPLGHWGDPMEQGKAAVFLASDLSSFVTGIYLPCDGGWLTL